MSALNSTNLTTMVDDPLMTASLSEFLLQVQSGLPQGSLRTGLSTPIGSVLLTTNSKENERIHGRSMRFDFEKDINFSLTNERALQAEMQDLLDRNKGFLVAWVMKNFSRWVSKGGKRGKTIDAIRDVLMKEMPNQQHRWHKGVARLLYTYVVFHQVAGVEPDIKSAILHMLKTGKVVVEEERSSSFWKRLQGEMNDILSDASKPALTWINPSVNVSVGGNFVPAIGITYQEIAGFTSVGYKETREEIGKCCGSGNSKSVTSTMVFACGSAATLEDMKKKMAGLIKKAKGYKIPKNILSPELVHKIEYVCGMRADEPPAIAETGMANCDSSGLSHHKEMEVLREALHNLEDINDSDNCQSSSDNDDADHIEDSSLIDELSPVSKLRYSLLTPRKKNYFRQGVLAGVRMANRVTDEPDVRETPTLLQEKQSDVPHASETSETPAFLPQEQSAASYRLKPKRSLAFDAEATTSKHADTTKTSHVEGTIGVNKRAKYNKNIDQTLCNICKLSSPKHCKQNLFDWVKCDSCKNWFHLFCLKMKSAPKSKSWKCKDCKQ